MCPGRLEFREDRGSPMNSRKEVSFRDDKGT